MPLRAGRGDYPKRDDRRRQFPAGGGSGSWGYGKADDAWSAGVIPDSPEVLVLDDKGPWFNDGAGEATGREFVPHYSFDDIVEGDWLGWEKKFGKVNVWKLCFGGGE